MLYLVPMRVGADWCWNWNSMLCPIWGFRYSFIVFEAVPSAVFQCSFECRGEPMCTLAFGRGAATKQASL